MEVMGKVKAGVVHLAEPLNVPDGTPVAVRVADAPNPYGNFWENLSLEELARRQGVKPITDVNVLQGLWPEEDDIDQFLREVKEMRK